MATLILSDPLIAVGDLDVSGDSSQAALEYGADEVEDTRFGAGTHVFAAGTLKTVSMSFSGRFEASGVGSTDQRMFDQLAKEAELSITPTRNDGDTAYLMKSARLQYSPSGSIGERFDFEASLNARGDLVRGKLLHDAQVTANATGTAVQLGAVGSDETLYAALHVVSASGSSPTLDVTIESDGDSSFAAPTTRITFDQATGRTSQWKSLAGAVADDWFRIDATVGGTNPDFTFIVTAGIL